MLSKQGKDGLIGGGVALLVIIGIILWGVFTDWKFIESSSSGSASTTRAASTTRMPSTTRAPSGAISVSCAGWDNTVLCNSNPSNEACKQSASDAGCNLKDPAQAICSIDTEGSENNRCFACKMSDETLSDECKQAIGTECLTWQSCGQNTGCSEVDWACMVEKDNPSTGTCQICK